MSSAQAMEWQRHIGQKNHLFDPLHLAGPGKTTSPDTSTTPSRLGAHWMPVGNSGSSFGAFEKAGRRDERFRAAPTPRWDGRDAEVFALPNCELSDEN